MKKVFIKYNPYKLETKITVGGKPLAENSKLGEKSVEGHRLQEWVEDVPNLLIDEYNDMDFEVTFHGTLLDYEDLAAVFTEARDTGKLTARLDHKPAKEILDKEKLIDDIFRQIQKGPFDELRDPEIVRAFEQAQSDEFEVCVVATMSAGKSTLINAMLGAKLMPSKQEACTAIITKIKDCSRDDGLFKAKVFNKEGMLSETYENLTYPIMVRLNEDNEDKDVSEIRISGNIPFVSSEDVSLVLIDTPGPNNARDPQHREVQSEFLGTSSKALILYIMTGEFGTDDDNALLKRIADSMSVNGKRSKDRFIFVVNKLDDRKKEDGDTSETLERVRKHLKTHGIVNPNLFPAAALLALNLRLMASGWNVDEDTIDDAETKTKKLNRNEWLHLEKYATLPSTMRGEIEGQLEETKSKWDGKKYENPDEALIHTGVISIEAAIRQYVQKYAKTAKIKNIVDAFMHKMGDLENFEKLKKHLDESIKNNNDKSKEMAAQIITIRKKLNGAEEAKRFKDDVEDKAKQVIDKSKTVVEKIIQRFQSRITKRIDALRDKEFSLDEVEKEVKILKKFSEDLKSELESQLDELIRTNLNETNNILLEAYKKKLAMLTDEIDVDNLTGIHINPLEFMGWSFGNFDTDDFTKEKKIKYGEEYIPNRDKKWYKPWTWNQEDGYWREKYKTVKYVNASELAREFFLPVEINVSDDGEDAYKYAIEQTERIKNSFNCEFKRLDNILEKKLVELENCINDQKNADYRARESEYKLNWLEEINKKIESIVEI